MTRIEASTLKKLLRYEPETGKLFWRRRPVEMFDDTGSGQEANCSTWNKRFSGKEALITVNNTGYLSGRILGAKHLSHRVIWAMETGTWPKGQIDHVNGVRTDNRISNLRDVSHTENQKNAKRRSDNSSGVTGVSWLKHSSKWSAQIKHEGKQIYLGLFDSLDDAIEARKAAEVKYRFHKNHGRKGSSQ